MLMLLMHLAMGPVPVAARAPLHYKIVAKTTTDLDLSAVGGPPQSVIMTISGFVAVTLADTAGGRIATITVDSSAFDAGMFAAQMPPEMTASSQGAVYHVYLVNGVPSGPIAAAPASIQAAQLVPGIELLLAGMHPRSTTGWVDTTRSDTTMTEGSAQSTRITTWTAQPGANGRMQLDGTFTGTTTVGTGPMKMEMQMTGATHVLAAPGGLSESGNSTASGQASMNLGGQLIPMKVTMEVTTSAVP